jgi:uncharacterized ParB-like nuclease family protein
LELSAIRCDCGTQIRAAIHEPTVDEYAEAMTQKADFPPVVVFHDGSQYVLADGFHRVMAASRRGQKQISADVRQGTKSDALRFALGANALHGLKRTNADKRRSVELALAEWPKLSNREIARVCAVGETLVRDTRPNCAKSAVEPTRIGADGKERRVPLRESAPIAAHADYERPAVNGEQEPSRSRNTAVVDEERPHIKTYDEEVEDVKSSITELKAQVEYHLNLVRCDAELVLERMQKDLIEPDDLKDTATELRFAAKTVEALRTCMEFPGIKQSSPRN